MKILEKNKVKIDTAIPQKGKSPAVSNRIPRMVEIYDVKIEKSKFNMIDIINGTI